MVCFGDENKTFKSNLTNHFRNILCKADDQNQATFETEHLLDCKRKKNGQKSDAQLCKKTDDHFDQYTTSFEVFGQNYGRRFPKQTRSDCEQKTISKRHLVQLCGKRCKQQSCKVCLSLIRIRYINLNLQSILYPERR